MITPRILPFALIVSLGSCFADDVAPSVNGQKPAAENKKKSSGPTGSKSPYAKYIPAFESLNKKAAALAALPSVNATEFYKLNEEKIDLTEEFQQAVRSYGLAPTEKENAPLDELSDKLGEDLSIISGKLSQDVAPAVAIGQNLASANKKTSSVLVGSKSPHAKHILALEHLDKKAAALAAQSSVSRVELHKFTTETAIITTAYQNELFSPNLAPEELAPTEEEDKAMREVNERLSSHSLTFMKKLNHESAPLVENPEQTANASDEEPLTEGGGMPAIKAGEKSMKSTGQSSSVAEFIAEFAIFEKQLAALAAKPSVPVNEFAAICGRMSEKNKFIAEAKHWRAMPTKEEAKALEELCKKATKHMEAIAEKLRQVAP